MAELTRSEEMFARALGRKAASSVGSSVAYSSGNGSATVYRETGRVTCVYSEGRLDVNLGSDDSPLMIESVPYTTACEGVQAGDTVIIETFGHRMVAVGVVSTSSDPQYRPATKAEMDEVDQNAEQAKADAAAAKELTDSVSGKLDEAKKQLDEAQKSLDAVQAEAKQAKSDSETALAEARKTGQMAVTATAYEYAASASPTEAPSTGWGADVPAHREGEYTWMRVTLTYGDGRSETTEPVPLTGDAGAKGDKGEKGDPGASGKDGATGPQGVSVASVTTFWQLSASQPATPSGAADPSGWSTTEPEVPDGYSGSEWRCLRTVLSSGVAAWTVPTRSASFSYAHKAYQTAQGAVSTANSAKSTAEGVSATLTRDYTPTADADKRYSTKAELSAKADEISSSVKETYATKAAVSTAQSAADAAKSAAGTAQTTADTAKADAKTAQDGVDALKSRVTTAETSIRQNSDAIALRATKTEVTSAIDSIKIGAVNLIPSSELLSKFVVESSARAAWSGNVLTRLNIASGAGSDYGIYWDFTGFNINETYTFSAEFSNLSSGGKFNISAGSKVGNNIWAGYRRNAVSTNGRRSVTFTVKSNETIVRLYISSTVAGASVKITKAQLELGNKATDWSPAPEDLEADATTKADKALAGAKTYTDAQLKVTSDSITSTVSKTYATKSELSTTNGNITNAQNTANTANSTANSVKSDLSNLSVGGVNLVRNSASGLAYSGFNAPPSSGVTYENNWKSPQNFLNGLIGQRWTVNTSSGASGPYYLLNSALGVYPKVGETYTLSAWMSVDKNAPITIYNIAESQQLIVSEATLTTGWTRIKVTFKAIVADSAVCFYTRVGADPGYVYMIGLKIEKGNRATDWSPSPLDYSTTTDTQSSIVQMSDSIRSSVEATYVSNDDAAGFARRTELTQLSDSFTAKISNTQKQVDAQGETVRNVEDYMTFAQESGQPTLTIGTSSSKFNTKLTNTGQRFMNGTDTVMELDGPSSTVSAQRLKIGKYRLQQSADGERLRIAYLG